MFYAERERNRKREREREGEKKRKGASFGKKKSLSDLLCTENLGNMQDGWINKYINKSRKV